MRRSSAGTKGNDPGHGHARAGGGGLFEQQLAERNHERGRDLGGDFRRGASGTTIVAQNFAFSPSSVNVSSGSVTLTVTNKDSTEHTFTLDDGSSDTDLQPGKTVTVKLDLTKTVGWHCEDPSHDDRHLAGRVVRPPANAPRLSPSPGSCPGSAAVVARRLLPPLGGIDAEGEGRRAAKRLAAAPANGADGRVPGSAPDAAGVIAASRARAQRAGGVS